MMMAAAAVVAASTATRARARRAPVVCRVVTEWKWEDGKSERGHQQEEQKGGCKEKGEWKVEGEEREERRKRRGERFSTVVPLFGAQMRFLVVSFPFFRSFFVAWPLYQSLSASQ